MGSPCELLVDTVDESLAHSMAEIAAAEAWRIEDKYSRYLSDNIVHAINNANGKCVSVDDETAGLIDFAAHIFELSCGKFDITSGVLRQVWRFDGGSQLPDATEVEALLAIVGWHRASWQRPKLTLAAGMQIDLGGIGKEYAVDRASGLLLNFTDTAALINFGGDVFANGSPRNQDGWQVGIDGSGALQGKAARLIHLRQGGLATSGDARRFILNNGVRYSHILDPTTGWPVKGAPHSVTVAADTCTQAGMLATLAMLGGVDAESFLRSDGCQYWLFD